LGLDTEEERGRGKKMSDSWYLYTEGEKGVKLGHVFFGSSYPAE